MLTMTRVPSPDGAGPATQTTGEFADRAREVITPLLPQIHEELDRLINEFVNDPEQCFADGDDFPSQSRLDGRYYIHAVTFEGNEDDDFFHLWLEIRCLEKRPGSETSDYLGLEIVVTVERDGAGFEFDEGFSISSV